MIGDPSYVLLYRSDTVMIGDPSYVLLYRSDTVMIGDPSYVLLYRSDKSPITSKRIHNIIEYLTFDVFCYSCRGLYEEHKFLFTLLLPLKIGLQEGAIKHDDFQTFIKGELSTQSLCSPPPGT